MNSASGFYIGYNYAHGSMASAGVAGVNWMFMDNHGRHNMMNLWEGNTVEMFGSDGYFGGSSHGTALRNYFTGNNRAFGTMGNPMVFNRLSYYYNLIGNVLGSAELSPPKYAETEDNCGLWPAKCNAVFRLGYPNIGNPSLTDVTGHPWQGATYPDAKVAATMLRWGNYDYFNQMTRWNSNEVPAGVPVPADQVIPDSYYYSNRPAWFKAGVPWPPIGPDVYDGNGDAARHVHTDTGPTVLGDV